MNYLFQDLFQYFVIYFDGTNTGCGCAYALEGDPARHGGAICDNPCPGNPSELCGGYDADTGTPLAHVGAMP